MSSDEEQRSMVPAIRCQLKQIIEHEGIGFVIDFLFTEELNQPAYAAWRTYLKNWLDNYDQES